MIAVTGWDAQDCLKDMCAVRFDSSQLLLNCAKNAEKDKFLLKYTNVQAMPAQSGSPIYLLAMDAEQKVKLGFIIGIHVGSWPLNTEKREDFKADYNKGVAFYTWEGFVKLFGKQRLRNFLDPDHKTGDEWRRTFDYWTNHHFKLADKDVIKFYYNSAKTQSFETRNLEFWIFTASLVDANAKKWLQKGQFDKSEADDDGMEYFVGLHKERLKHGLIREEWKGHGIYETTYFEDKKHGFMIGFGSVRHSLSFWRHGNRIARLNLNSDWEVTKN